MPAKPVVRFFYEQDCSLLRNRNRLKSFIAHLFRNEKVRLGEINYIFSSDQRLLEMNLRFLAHDYYTDIITFDLSAGDEIQGEVYISIDRVRDNAINMGQPMAAELHRVIFHGALHLCGYRDKTTRESAIMRKKEDFYLSTYRLFHA